MDKQNPAEVEDFTYGAGMTSGDKKKLESLKISSPKSLRHHRMGHFTSACDCGELEEALLMAP